MTASSCSICWPTTSPPVGAVCLNIRGAKGLPSVLDPEVLFQFSVAPIVIVLDNLRQQTIQPIWWQIQEAGKLGPAGQKQLDLALRDLEKVGGGEAKWLRSLACNAVESGDLNRLSVFGVPQTDVICYLPPGDFVNGESKWTPLLFPFLAGDPRLAPTPWTSKIG